LLLVVVHSNGDWSEEAHQQAKVSKSDQNWSPQKLFCHLETTEKHRESNHHDSARESRPGKCKINHVLSNRPAVRLRNSVIAHR
jgi:hypothetical protein